MLKQHIKENLETVVQYTLMRYSGDETLAFDISKQCISDEDVDKCLEVMLEHVSEQELTLLVELVKSDVHRRYTQAITESMRAIDDKIGQTLRLLNEKAGEA